MNVGAHSGTNMCSTVIVGGTRGAMLVFVPDSHGLDLYCLEL